MLGLHNLLHHILGFINQLTTNRQENIKTTLAHTPHLALD